MPKTTVTTDTTEIVIQYYGKPTWYPFEETGIRLPNKTIQKLLESQDWIVIGNRCFRIRSVEQ